LEVAQDGANHRKQWIGLRFVILLFNSMLKIAFEEGTCRKLLLVVQDGLERDTIQDYGARPLKADSAGEDLKDSSDYR
jgi:hypothetical protein